MKRFSLAVVFFVCVAGLLGASRAGAIMRALSTEALTRASSHVVVGTVTRVESMWSSDGKSIVTQALVEVAEPVKGSMAAGRTVVVETWGGTVDGITQHVSDVPTFGRGEEVVLFLTPVGSRGARRLADSFADSLPGVFAVQGLAQGKYAVSGGHAQKRGFSILGDAREVDSDLPVAELLDKVRRAAR